MDAARGDTLRAVWARERILEHLTLPKDTPHEPNDPTRHNNSED
jgi:hypothetical protein